MLHKDCYESWEKALKAKPYSEEKHSACARVPNERGFSLVELMVTLVLSLFLIGGVVAIFSAARVTAIETENLSRAQENIRFASDFLVRDLRNAGFRDQLTLTFDQFVSIGESFAAHPVNNGAPDRSQLIVRYAGRAPCGRAFSLAADLLIIENQYFIDANGEFRCVGRQIVPGAVVDPNPTNVVLASGFSRLDFQFLDSQGLPTAANPCAFPTPQSPIPQCAGVRVHLFPEGPGDRAVELTASFRNVILERLYAQP